MSSAAADSHSLGVFEWRAQRCWRRFTKRRVGIRAVKAFLDEFRSFAMFHACRPANVEPYYRLGLQLADHDCLTAAARRIFVAEEFPEISAAEFDDIAREISRIDDRKVYPFSMMMSYCVIAATI